MLVTCIHCSDYSAEGILKIVLFFGYLVSSYYGFTCFCLVGVYHGPMCSHCFCVKHSTLGFGQYNHVPRDSDWLLKRINWCPCTLQFSDMRYRQKWNVCHAVLLRWFDVHLIKTLSQHIRVGRWLNSEYGSTWMAGSVRNLSWGSNTGPANITIHEPEALIPIIVGSLDRISVGFINLYCPALMRTAFTLTMCVGSLIPVLNLQKKYSGLLNNITFYYFPFFVIFYIFRI